MAPRLRIDLNGPLDIRRSDEKPAESLSRRGLAMLAYLAMQPRMTSSRAAVMTLLWGERSEEQARASLRQELSVMRRTLPENTLTADRLNVWLANTEAIRPGDREFLAGFDLSAPVFEEWLRDTRFALERNEGPALKVERRKTNRPSLAIMPFEEYGKNNGDVLVDGMVEEITGSLSRIREFHVIARQSAYALKGEQINAIETAKRLGVDYLVTGGVYLSGQNVRISTQLVDGRNGRALWVGKFDDRLADLFGMQDQVALQIAGQISPNLREAEIRKAQTQKPADLTAYEHLQRAFPPFWTHSREHNLRAIAHLDAALEKDKNYAHALALKAWCHAQHPIYLWSEHPEKDRATALKLAFAAAEQARQHAPTLTAIGAAYSIAGDDAALALSYIERALEIDPSNAWAWLRLGWHGVYTGDIPSAEKAFQNALDLSPLDPFKFNMLTGLASLLMLWTDRFDEAITILEDGLRLNPTATWQYRELIPAYYKAGHTEKLSWAGQQLLKSYPGLTLIELRRSFAKINAAVGEQYMGAFVEAGVPAD